MTAVREKYNIMLAGSFDVLEGQVIRIGHMGENCREDKVRRTLHALQLVLTELGVTLLDDLEKCFMEKQ